MTSRPFLAEAHACRIHGLIKQTGGAITVAQLSDRLGIAPTTVRDIVQARGWTRRIGRKAPTIHLVDPEVDVVELHFD
ncbi:winged helix-turn-helix domain-containing protein [Ketogulonicigenium vulgare]|uniref:winged helix-turn-helix domain-containing protein n=1 Tax=Ketogulonicigenium vulgare TaxID=92945 RepID=UPI0023582F25|nr:winged helix-turn-helix domain-containing protein [Ketogulonicigenium vulgare]